VILYQEQVMQIAQVLAGYTLGAGRPAAPRDGQEKARGDGQAAQHLRQPVRPATAFPRRTRPASST
jgi:hypothetical protein